VVTEIPPKLSRHPCQSGRRSSWPSLPHHLANVDERYRNRDGVKLPLVGSALPS
jgi:hypothetical protein